MEQTRITEQKQVVGNKNGQVSISDYPYFPKSRQSFVTSPIRKEIERQFAIHRSEYEEMIAKIMACANDFLNIYGKKQNDTDPFWENPSLPVLDSAMLYAVTVAFQPRFYVEIGSGFSTRFVARAISDHNLHTKIISIDPCPRAEIDTLCSRVIRTGLEDVDLHELSFLSSDDILILDGSHRAFPNSDVTVFFCEILPNLPSGLIYAIHDIALPQEIFCDRYYNEQYMLAMYLLGGACGDKIFFPSGFISQLTGLLDDKGFLSADRI